MKIFGCTTVFKASNQPKPQLVELLSFPLVERGRDVNQKYNVKHNWNTCAYIKSIKTEKSLLVSDQHKY